MRSNACTAREFQPTRRPPARRPHGDGAQPHSPSVPKPRAAAGHQGGRCARAWLFRNAGYLSIAIGWALCFAAVVVPKEEGFAVALVELAVFGGAAFGFGAGWQARGGGAR